MPKSSTPTPTLPTRRSARVQTRNQEMIAVEQPSHQTVRATRKRPTRNPDDEAESSQPTSDGEPIQPKENTEWDASSDPAPGQTDSAKIGQPIHRLVHKSLRAAWTINSSLPMCFIFDAVSPARRFKRGMPYSDSDAAVFPEYNASESGNVTETDGPEPGFMPYVYKQYRYDYWPLLHTVDYLPGLIGGDTTSGASSPMLHSWIGRLGSSERLDWASIASFQGAPPLRLSTPPTGSRPRMTES